MEIEAETVIKYKPKITRLNGPRRFSINSLKYLLAKVEKLKTSSVGGFDQQLGHKGIQNKMRIKN